MRWRLIVYPLVLMLVLSFTVLKDSDIDNFEDINSNPRRRGCVGTGPVELIHPPRLIEDIEYILPQGLMLGSHVTPIDHQYYIPHNWQMEVTIDDMIDVYAPADGVIVGIQEMPAFFTHDNPGLGDYNFKIYHTCTFYTAWIHLYTLSPKLQRVLDNRELVEVKAGEIIGSANSFDFSVHDEDVTLSGFITPELYEIEDWKIHTVDPYDYFVEPVRSQLLAKNLRQVEPLGGKLDYDIDGKLIGNWFIENTNGYQGVTRPEYWDTHLSVSPDAYDPTYFIISLGDFNGEARQFAPKGGMKNPATITVEDGLLKYELVGFEYIDGTGNKWDNQIFSDSVKPVDSEWVSGVVLLQMLEDRKLRAENFPGKALNEVSGFTNDAKIYVR
ncbi:MAG: M23 family metallopeptidase [Candidatus Altiarchaeota archaeon]|nr:M23 family metallopeptidase [Candidatus Altiarchaeota archaeon]